MSQLIVTEQFLRDSSGMGGAGRTNQCLRCGHACLPWLCWSNGSGGVWGAEND